MKSLILDFLFAFVVSTEFGSVVGFETLPEVTSLFLSLKSYESLVWPGGNFYNKLPFLTKGPESINLL